MNIFIKKRKEKKIHPTLKKLKKSWTLTSATKQM